MRHCATCMQVVPMRRSCTCTTVFRTTCPSSSAWCRAFLCAWSVWWGAARGLSWRRGIRAVCAHGEDLAREGVRLVNRERGCGSRVLFDEKMREFGLNVRAVNGYDREVSSALTAASLVARGAADVCIGSERVFHQVEGVDFLPLQDEWLDIAFLENERSIPVVDAAVRLIRSRAFKEEASRIVGYSTEHMGETVYKR